MATFAAPGKTLAQPRIIPALWTQDCFFARKTRFSWSPQFYFYDNQGRTLAFVRNTMLSGTKEIRVFTDPTLSFELLAIKPQGAGKSQPTFAVSDSMSHQPVGSIRPLPAGRLQRRHWSLLDALGLEVGDLAEDSVLLAGMRRVFSDLVPQTYTFMTSDQQLGKATHGGCLLAPAMRIDLSADNEKKLDRRLVTAAIVVLLATAGQSPALAK